MTVDQMLQIENTTTENLRESLLNTSPVLLKNIFYITKGVVEGRIAALSSVIDALNENEGEVECQKELKSRKK